MNIADILVDVRAVRERKAKELASLDAAILELEQLDGAVTSPKSASKLRGGVSMKPPRPAAAKGAARPCGCGPLGRHLSECKLGKKAAAPAPKKKGPWGKAPKAHGVPGKPGVVLGQPLVDAVTCGVCGRGDVQKSTGPGGYMKFHRAPCGLPCNGSNLVHLTAEDRADGTHSKKNCLNCGKREASA